MSSYPSNLGTPIHYIHLCTITLFSFTLVMDNNNMICHYPTSIPLYSSYNLQPFKIQQDNDRWRWSCSWLHNIPNHKRRIFLIYSTRKIMWICHSIADMIIVLILKKKKLFQPNVRLIQLENGTDNCCHQYKQMRPWKVQCHIALPPYGQPYVGSARIDMKFFHVNKSALDLVNDNVVFVVVIQLWIHLVPSTIFSLSRLDEVMTDDDRHQ